MLEQILALWTTPTWWSYLLRVVALFLLAWLVYRFSWSLADRLLRVGQLSKQGRQMRPERYQTLRSLFASAITILAFLAAVILTLSQFVRAETLIWMVGLFSAAFGLGARPLISDFLTGISFLFEDPFDVGDKVALLAEEGVVEKVNLRTTMLRSPSGELLVVPNGEIRLVRNYSRGLFSPATITLKLAAGDLPQALPVLETLGKEAVMLLPNLLEPWRIISESGEMGQQTELTLLAKARFGMGAEMRPRLLALVHERLQETGIQLTN
ncbi:MAG: mechanosensitive ion channel family protein [Anaerolineae bacterium]|nr:mechanosensitive ion channel family protein [Anaerolineae bacterium]